MWLIIAIVGVRLMSGLMSPGLPMLHDANPHIARAIAYHTSLADGYFPPLWAKEVMGGIGSPVLMLNYQLPYLVGEVWQRFGANVFESYKLTLGVTFVLSGLFLYWALVKEYGRWGAGLSALLYTLAPYRMVDIYVRGALGEAMSFMFPPLILWGLQSRSAWLMTVGWSGLFLTHPVAAAVFSAFFWGKTLVEKRKMREFFWPYGLALLIAAFNILPTLAYTRYTYYSPALSNTLAMFPTLSQLVDSPWGYGVSVPGDGDGMSFEMGKIQWLVLIGFVGLMIKRRRALDYFLTLAVVLNIYLMLPDASWIYRAGLAKIIDFPWRLLMSSVFGIALMGAILVQELSNKWGKVAITIVGGLLLLQTIPMARVDRYWGEQYDKKFFARETGDSYGEYAALTRESRDSSPFGLRAEVLEGRASLELIHESSQQLKLKVVAETESKLRINTMYFPGWTTTVDGKSADCAVSKRTLPHIDDSGLVVCLVPAGNHELVHEYRALPLQKLGNLLTLVGIGGWLWTWLASFCQRITNEKR